MELCWVKIPYLLSKTKLTTFARHMLSQMAQGEVAGSAVEINDFLRKLKWPEKERNERELLFLSLPHRELLVVRL